MSIGFVHVHTHIYMSVLLSLLVVDIITFSLSSFHRVHFSLRSLYSLSIRSLSRFVDSSE